jgi:hypothetical protein
MVATLKIIKKLIQKIKRKYINTNYHELSINSMRRNYMVNYMAITY